MDVAAGMLYALLGLGVGLFGTLIGAGGGFILVPILILTQRDWRPEQITAVSLTVVFFNALSGTAAYARMRRIDYRSGLAFAAATVPTAILGAITTGFLPRRTFDLVFGILILAACVFLILRPEPKPLAEAPVPDHHTDRELVDAKGTVYRYSFDIRIGIWLSLGVGYISSLLGIGGGIVHVPALVHLLRFPVHVATATSQFMLGIMALFGVSVHLANGVLDGTYDRLAWLIPGVLIGAQLGARLSRRLAGGLIVRFLAAALGLVGVRVLWGLL